MGRKLWMGPSSSSCESIETYKSLKEGEIQAIKAQSSTVEHHKEKLHDSLTKLTHPGQPSNVDTVNKVSIALATSSKCKRFLVHLRSSTCGWLISPSSNTRYVPLEDINIQYLTTCLFTIMLIS